MHLHHFSKSKLFVVMVTLFIIVLPFVSVVHAASNAELVIVEKDPRSYKVVEGSEIYQNFTFTVREVSDVYAARVRTEATDLEDSKKSINIPANNIYMTLENGSDATKEFILSAGQTQKVYVSVKVQGANPGTYEGKISVIGINASDTAFSLRIVVSKPLYIAYTLNFIGILLGVTATFFGIILPKKAIADVRKDFGSDVKKYLPSLIAGIVVVLVVFFGTVGAYYNTITDFGASGFVDYAAAILFGLGQYGAGNAGTTIAKGVQERFQ